MSYQGPNNRTLVNNHCKPQNKTNLEFRDRASIKSGFRNSSSTQGTSTGSIEMQIKSEYNEDNSFASSPAKPIKTEYNYEPSSFTPLKMPKKELSDTEMTYTCCSIKFKNKYHHFEHMIYHTEEMMRYSQNRNVKCPYCSRYFRTENCMIRHLKSAHKRYNCIYCMCHFSEKPMLLIHLQAAHNIPVKYNQNYPQPKHRQWRKKKWCKPVDIQSVKIKKEDESSTPDIKFTPNLANVKMELDVTNIKTEPHLNVEVETIPIIKMETVTE